MLLTLLACALSQPGPAEESTPSAQAFDEVEPMGPLADELVAVGERIAALEDELDEGGRPREVVLDELDAEVDRARELQAELRAALEAAERRLHSPSDDK